MRCTTGATRHACALHTPKPHAVIRPGPLRPKVLVGSTSKQNAGASNHDMDFWKQQVQLLDVRIANLAARQEKLEDILLADPRNPEIQLVYEDAIMVYKDISRDLEACWAERLKAVEAMLSGSYVARLAAANRAAIKGIKAWAEALVKVATLLHATDAELEKMSDADRRAAQDMHKHRFIPMPEGLADPWLPAALTDSFYNRPVYDDFLTLIDTLGTRDEWALVIAGDPGIGKSRCALRLILKLAAQRKKVVYEYAKDGRGDTDMRYVYIDFSDPRDIKVDLAGPADIERFDGYYADPQVFRLVDGRTPSVQYNGTVRTIVFAFPDAEQWYEFAKTARWSCDKVVFTREAWMPCWTADELVHAAVGLGLIQSLEERQLIEDRFKDLGGNAGRVLGDYRPSHAILEGMKTSLTSALAKQLVRCEAKRELDEITHHILHYVHAVVTDDLKFDRWKLSSDIIAQMVHDKFSAIRHI